MVLDGRGEAGALGDYASFVVSQAFGVGVGEPG